MYVSKCLHYLTSLRLTTVNDVQYSTVIIYRRVWKLRRQKLYGAYFLSLCSACHEIQKIEVSTCRMNMQRFLGRVKPVEKVWCIRWDPSVKGQALRSIRRSRFTYVPFQFWEHPGMGTFQSLHVPFI